jgi:hypothetical protein
MSDLKDNLRLICHPEARSPLGQGILSGPFFLIPLHVLNSDFLRGVAGVRIGKPSYARLTQSSISILKTVPESDCAICVINERTDYELRLANNVQVGDVLDVHILKPYDIEGVCYELTKSVVRDIVIAGCHTYQSSCGTSYSICDVLTVLLTDPMPKGSSGAAICLAGSDLIVGFVHGNAAENHGGAICLNPQPIIASLNMVSPSDLQR